MSVIEMRQDRVRPVAPSVRSETVRKALLACGVLASLLYVAMLVLTPMRWEGYSSASQAVSELSAIGAPSRPQWVALAAIYSMLMTAFGLGVWLSSGPDRRLRVAGGVLAAQSILGLFWPPMHLRGQEMTLTDVMHIVFSMAWLLLMLLAIGVGAAALGKRFRLYSAATLAIFVVFGVLTGMDGPRIAANLPTPWLGIWERINIGAALAWIVVFAVALLRRPSSTIPPDVR